MIHTTFSAFAPLSAVICRKSLADAVKLLAKVIEKRNTIPILSCVVIRPGSDAVTVAVSDLDIWAEIAVPASCQPGAAVAVDFSALKAALAKSKAESVELADIGGNRVTYRDCTSGVTLRLPSLPVDDFPQPNQAMRELGHGFALDAAQLRDDLARARPAVSTEETRYYLNGTFWHCCIDEYGRDRFRIAATDGHRAVRIDRERPADMPTIPDSIVPRKTGDVLAQLIAKASAGDEVRADFCASAVRFRFKRCTIFSKLIDGTFPDYSRVIPSVVTDAVQVPADRLADAVKSVTAHMSGRTRAVKLSWSASGGWLTASAYCPDNGPAMVEVEGPGFAEAGDAPFVIYCNAAYLVELLGAFGSATVALRCSDSAAPFRIEAADMPEYLQVLMPMRGDSYSATSPADIAALNRSPVDTFNAEAPRVLESMAEIAASDLTPSAKRAARRAASRELAGLVRGAINHLAATAKPAPVPMSRGVEMVAGGKMVPVPMMSAQRRGARLAVLCALAGMRGDDAAQHRYAAEATHSPTGSFLAMDEAARILDPRQPGEHDLAPAQIQSDDVCSGPMCNGEAWDSIFADLERGYEGFRVDVRDGTASLVNCYRVERNGLQRTRIPARHQARALELAERLAGGDQPDAPEPVIPDVPGPGPVPGEAEPVPVEEVAAVVIPAPAGEKPMFRTLQDFKAMAGVGSRWSLRNWDSRAGEWGEERFRIVATVKARDLGFVDGDATALDVAAAGAMKGHAGRSWIAFPKQGEWESTPAGLVTMFRDRSPCMMICPAPIDHAEPDGGDAPGQPEGDAAELRALVVQLAARIERLEAGQERAEPVEGLPDVGGAESLPAPAGADLVPVSELEAMRARAEAAESRVADLEYCLDAADRMNDAERAKWKVERQALEAARDEAQANAGRAVASSIRFSTRVYRLTAVLAGRKEQLKRRSDELQFAHGKAAQLQRELVEARRGAPGPVPVTPTIIMPAFSKAG